MFLLLPENAFIRYAIAPFIFKDKDYFFHSDFIPWSVFFFFIKYYSTNFSLTFINLNEYHSGKS